jgi:hypothetical protein
MAESGAHVPTIHVDAVLAGRVRRDSGAASTSPRARGPTRLGARPACPGRRPRSWRTPPSTGRTTIGVVERFLTLRAMDRQSVAVATQEGVERPGPRTYDGRSS